MYKYNGTVTRLNRRCTDDKFDRSIIICSSIILRIRLASTHFFVLDTSIHERGAFFLFAENGDRVGKLIPTARYGYFEHRLARLCNDILENEPFIDKWTLNNLRMYEFLSRLAHPQRKKRLRTCQLVSTEIRSCQVWLYVARLSEYLDVEMSLRVFLTRNVRDNIKFVKKEKVEGRKRTNDCRATPKPEFVSSWSIRRKV